MMKMVMIIIIPILTGQGAIKENKTLLVCLIKVIIMVIIVIVIVIIITIISIIIISIISVLLNPHLKRIKHCVREQLSRHSLRIPTHATFNVNYNSMQ